MHNYAPRTDERLSIAGLLGAPQMQRAFQFVNEIGEQLDQELVTICEIPSPPFKEQARAAEISRRFNEIGLSNVRFDQEGNVLAELTGTLASPSVVVSAHLDTVFPEGTDVRVRRDGPR